MSDPRAWRPIEPAGGAAPAGAFSPGVAINNLILTSGQIPQHPDSGEIEREGSFEAQARLVFDNLRRVVEAAGSDLAHVVSVTVYLDDIADWGELDRLYREVFAPPYPARAVVGVHLEKFRVEASAIAVRKDGRERAG